MARRRRRRPAETPPPEVTLDAVCGPDRLAEILGSMMTMEESVAQVVDGAKQTRKDTYKWNALQTVLAWQGIRPSDKQDVSVKGPLQIVWGDE